MARISTIPFALALCAAGLGAPLASRASEPEARVAIKRACLPPNETREEVKTHHLLEPFAVLKSAAAQFKAEAISAKLCHLGDEFVYEIALLHRDGRLVHVVVNAATGKFLGARNAREPMPKI
ncbi:MAG: PepSY domain-containing protein [Roseiarcus sp.]